jgi:hypothetical protein
MKTQIEADNIGTLHIRFSENYTLDLFPDNSLGNEYWRFFKRGSITSHFVVTGKGVEE